MRAPRSPSSYEEGPGAAGLAAIYLAIVALLITAAADETGGAGVSDGSFLWGFALVATLPLSLVVMLGYSALEAAAGVPAAQQDGGLWTLGAFALCALLNAIALYVGVRGSPK